jgi:hypothetical protein
MNNITDGFYVLVSRAFGIYTPAQFVMFFQNVIDLVTGNAPFAGITPTVPVAQAAVDDLKTKDLAALNKGRLETVARNASHRDALVIGRQWANFVDANCGDSLETLLSSGFLARRAPTPPAPPQTPGNVRLTHGDASGKVILRCRGRRINRNYSAQYAESPDGPWTSLPLSTKTTIEITGLTAGKTYWFQVRANGTKGFSEWSPAVSIMAV